MACTVANPMPSTFAAQGAAAALCVFFDLETTGLDPCFAEVIEIAAVARLLLPSGAWHRLRSPSGTEAEFRELVTPSCKLPKKISRLTGISNECLLRAGQNFTTAMSVWQLWLQKTVRVAESLAASLVGSVQVGCWLVGHNSLGFDLPFLVSQHAREQRLKARSTCGLHPIAPLFEGLIDFAGLVDTLRLSRSMARNSMFKPPALTLQALHSHLLKRPLPAAHTALGDTRGLAEICMQEPMCQTLLTAIRNSNGIEEQRRDASLMGIVATLRQAIVSCSHRVHAHRRSTTAKMGRRLSHQGAGRKRGRTEQASARNCWHLTHHVAKLTKQDCTSHAFIREPPRITLTTLSGGKDSLQLGVLAATVGTATAEAAAAAAATLDRFPGRVRACNDGQPLPVAVKHRRWKRQTLRQARR